MKFTKYIQLFVIAGLVAIFFANNSVSALVPISSRVPTKYNKKVNTTLPHSSVFRLAGSTSHDVNYWKQVLDDRDKNKDTYLVIPSNGLVIPINTVPRNSPDYKNMLLGKKIDENKYLKTGAVEYPGLGTSGYGQIGNKVIF